MTLRLLVVDDDTVDRLAVRRALRTAGVDADIEEAGSADAALEAIRHGAFDGVFLDFNLPGGDGLDVVRGARALGFSAPIIVLTGQRDDETAVRLMKAGASDYMVKEGMTPERLERTLHSALRVHQAEAHARQAERALRESEARFRVLHETSPDGFMIFRAVRDDTGGMVDAIWEYVNPAGEELIGYPADTLLGRRLLEMMPGVEPAGIYDLYREVVEGGQPRQVEVHYTEFGFDGWLRISAAKLGDGFAVSLADISRRKHAEEERERALSARNRFFAAMSHEIRTPMNAILGYTDLLLIGAYGDLSEKQREGIERAHRAAQHLTELVNDVLDLSKLEAGKIELQMEEVSLSTLVIELLATLQPLAEERRIELVFEGDGCDQTLRTDPRRLRQILMNLLSNALKFGGGHPVAITCTPAGENGFVLRVVDHGPGIATEDLSRIFEEFVQLGNSEEERGTGLGLAISKRLAELLGARIEVDSVPGEGTTFTLRLPPGAHESTDSAASPAAAATDA